MTAKNQIVSNTFSKMSVMVLFAMLLLSSATMFAQTTTDNNAANAVATMTSVSENTTMNLFSWFMGAKQTPNSNLKNDDSNNIKKQMINSGTEPNRLLLKAFLKKATSYNEMMA